MARTASRTRKTNETDISLELNLDGSGNSQLDTGIGFFDHMLDLLTRHALWDLSLRAEGDLQVDQHHTVEDVGICLGEALNEALGDKSGITRYGHITLPMEETLVSVAVDLSGRTAFVYKADIPQEKIGTFDAQLVKEFWNAVAANARLNLHVLLWHGENAHHIAEAVFKGTARALRQAVAIDPRQSGVPSTKGSL